MNLFRWDENGRFQIQVGDKKSSWTPYQQIAYLDTGTDCYIGLSPYWDGLPIETVIKIEAVTTDLEINHPGITL